MERRYRPGYCKVCGDSAVHITPAGEQFCRKHWREHLTFLRAIIRKTNKRNLSSRTSTEAQNAR